MASALRAWLQSIGRAALQKRTYASAAGVYSPGASSGVVGIPTSSRRPIGGFRGALTGFAVGFGAASAYGYIYLLREYHTASSAMLASVRELQESTYEVTSAFARVSALEEQVQRLDHQASTKEDVLRRTSDLTRVYDALHEDVLELRRKLFDVEQDINRALGTPTARQANGRIV